MRVVHLTHPKSGSHWVTDVLSDPECLAFVQGIRFKRCEDHSLAYWSEQPDGFFMGPMFSVTFDRWSRHRRVGDKAIYVLRDPRDCIVSWTFSFTYSHDSQPHVRLIRPVLLSASLRHKLLIGIYQYWQSSWIVQSWGGRPRTQTEYPVTYEAILTDEFREFRGMLDFLGWNVPDDVLSKVIAYHAFERRSRGRTRGELDQYSHYRLGVAGDWQNYFDRELGELFERACPRLLIDLGYESSEEWYDRLPETLPALNGTTSGEPAPAQPFAESRLQAERAHTAANLRYLVGDADRLLAQIEELERH